MTLRWTRNPSTGRPAEEDLQDLAAALIPADIEHGASVALYALAASSKWRYVDAIVRAALQVNSDRLLREDDVFTIPSSLSQLHSMLTAYHRLKLQNPEP